MWWSGLTKRDVDAGMSLTNATREGIEGIEYWSLPNHSGPGSSSVVCLLPPYDQYLVGYRDGAAVPRPRADRGVVPAAVVVDGRVVGTWEHLRSEGSIEVTPFGAPTSIARQSLLDAGRRYGTFVGDAGLRVVVTNRRSRNGGATRSMINR
jgi:hypothetical protein